MEDLIGAPIDVWPDNWVSVSVMVNCSTQWQSGPGGATGLNYAAIKTVMEMTGVDKDDWPFVFQDIRVMENTALGVMHQKKD